MRRFVLSFALCYFILVFFSPLSIAITWLGEERVYPNTFRTFVRFALVWFCLFPLPLGIWEGLRFVIVALPGLFSYLFLSLALYVMLLLHYMMKEYHYIICVSHYKIQKFLYIVYHIPYLMR